MSAAAMQMERAAATKPTKLTRRINRLELSGTSAVVNEVARLRAAGTDLIDLGAGEPHFATPQHIKEAAIEAIKADFTKYTAVPGTDELRDAITRRHAVDFGSNYGRHECIASAGGKQALFTAIEVLVNSGDEVIVPVPYWVSFRDIVRFAGGKCIFAELDDDSPSLAAKTVERVISARTKAIILNSPNNPSGAVLSPDVIRAIVEVSHRRGIYLICDECYVYLTYNGRPFSAGLLTEARQYAIIIGSLSKTYAMTGWRLGYALGPAPIVAAMQKLQSQTISCPSSVSQKAAIAALNGSQFCIEDMRSEYAELRDFAFQRLSEIEGMICERPAGAFYIFPNVSTFLRRLQMRSARELTQILLERAHVVTIPGDVFGAPDHVRISYAVSRRELERGLKQIQKSLSAG